MPNLKTCKMNKEQVDIIRNLFYILKKQYKEKLITGEEYRKSSDELLKKLNNYSFNLSQTEILKKTFSRPKMDIKILDTLDYLLSLN